MPPRAGGTHRSQSSIETRCFGTRPTCAHHLITWTTCLLLKALELDGDGPGRPMWREYRLGHDEMPTCLEVLQVPDGLRPSDRRLDLRCCLHVYTRRVAAAVLLFISSRLLLGPFPF